MIKWWQFRKRYHCPHSTLMGYYGDEIIRNAWFRLRCMDCGKLLDGHPNLAKSRRGEAYEGVIS